MHLVVLVVVVIVVQTTARTLLLRNLELVIRGQELAIQLLLIETLMVLLLVVLLMVVVVVVLVLVVRVVVLGLMFQAIGALQQFAIQAVVVAFQCIGMEVFLHILHIAWLLLDVRVIVITFMLSKDVLLLAHCVTGLDLFVLNVKRREIADCKQRCLA